MKEKIICTVFFLILVSCSNHSSPIILNEDFEKINKENKINFSELIGKYELDSISKERFKIPQETIINIELRSDTIIIANDYIDITTGKLKGEKFSNKLFNIYNFNENYLINDFSIANKPFFNGGGNIEIYKHKKDGTIALYVFIPFIPATTENNMQYRESDYLRYIKTE